MRSDYLELPLYLEHLDEDATVDMYVHLRDKSLLMFTNVSSDPIRYEGWWTVTHTLAGRQATSHIPASEVLYFSTFTGEEPHRNNNIPVNQDHRTVCKADKSQDALGRGSA